MDLKSRIIELLTKNPDGLKASKISSLIGTTSHEVNSFLYSNQGDFEIDDSYVWRIKAGAKALTPAVKPKGSTRTVSLVEDTPAVAVPSTPGKRYAYYNLLDTFLDTDETQWIEKMREGFNEAFQLPLDATQIGVWRDCYRALQRELVEFNEQHKNYYIIFEYALPYESGRRPDVILISENYVFVLEFKKKNQVIRADVDQAAAYGRDIEEYHFETRGKEVITYLVITELKDYFSPDENDLIFICSGDRLGKCLLEDVEVESDDFDIETWINSKYEPLPTIVEAARMIMAKEELPNIRRVNSTGIPDAIKCLEETTAYAKENSKHMLALVTGVPGSGKTFLGLQFVYNICEKENQVNSVYLSGNGPLVEVLKNALHSGVFVKDLHKVENEYLQSGARDFCSNVIVFDEGQRAWDIKRMSEKGRGNISEPEIMVRLADERLNWCVMLILVGEGQEIHLGEGSGLAQWNDALNVSRKAWEVICPDKLASTFRGRKVLNIKNRDKLDLTVTLRSHLAGDVSIFVNHIIDGNIIAAKRYADGIKREGFTMLITRDLDAAREYCATRYEGQISKRYGLVASSKDKMLPRYGVDNSWGATRATNTAKWFNTDASSGVSCCNMQKVVTEFACQGLELDFPIVCWGNDMTWEGNQWHLTASRGGDGHADLYRTNSYRVLMTRGRDGFIVYVPDDRSLDKVYDVLVKAGIDELD